MSALSEQEKELVAIGASIGSNCVPCIAFHVGKAREAGLTDEQIRAAITISEEVRALPASLVVNTAKAHLDRDFVTSEQSSSTVESSGCGCKNSTSEVSGKVSGSNDCGC